MADAILVVNAGSSSIKFSLFVERNNALAVALRGQIGGLYTRAHFSAKDAAGALVSEKSWNAGVNLGHDGAIDHLTGFLPQEIGAHRLVGVGHRVVHGGLAHMQPVRIDTAVLATLERFVPLAPLHQPHNLTPIRRLLERDPKLPQVACFDTSFHRTQSAVAQRFALPEELHQAGVQRYGFHGLSYEYIASVLPQYDAQAASGRAVVLHLGNGASMCALQAGNSVDSTMGFTAVDGLPMGTRCGSIDPGVLLYLMNERGMSAQTIETLIYSQSGLLGVSGISSDMRTLLASNEGRARLAIDLYVYRIRQALGALAATLGGLDAIVFTAGIGENSASIRERICRDAAWLDVALDVAANKKGGPRISAAASPVSVWVIPTNEELMIARHTQALVAPGSSTAAVSA